MKPSTEAHRRLALGLYGGCRTIAESEWIKRGGSFRELFRGMYGQNPVEPQQQHLDLLTGAIAVADAAARAALAAELLPLLDDIERALTTGQKSKSKTDAQDAFAALKRAIVKAGDQ